MKPKVKQSACTSSGQYHTIVRFVVLSSFHDNQETKKAIEFPRNEEFKGEEEAALGPIILFALRDRYGFVTIGSRNKEKMMQTGSFPN